MARISGAEKHARRLARLRRETALEVAKRLYAGGQNIELDAELSITAGSISGKNHVPSEPGQPPNADTRHLDTNIETKLVDSYNPKVTVTSQAEYSAWLEYGTEDMAARPFMRPALEKNRSELANSVKYGVNAVIRKSGQ